MRYFPQQVPLCTTGVHDQPTDICIQGYLRILWIRNTKSAKTPKWVLYATKKNLMEKYHGVPGQQIGLQGYTIRAYEQSVLACGKYCF